MHTNREGSRRVDKDNQAIVGRCMLMCPEREKRRLEKLHHQIIASDLYHCRRQREKSLHVLEVGRDERCEVTAVKEYVRAGAGHLLPHPDDLRPPEMLIKTMEYLIRK